MSNKLAANSKASAKASAKVSNSKDERKKSTPSKTTPPLTTATTTTTLSTTEATMPNQIIMPREISLKEAFKIVFEKSDENLNNSNKWPHMIDTAERFSAFCRHRDTRYITCFNKEDLEANKLRLAVLSAYFYGLPLIIDIMDNENLIESFKSKLNIYCL